MANWKERRRWIIEWQLIPHENTDGIRRTYPAYPMGIHISRKHVNASGWGRLPKSFTFNVALKELIAIGKQEAFTREFHWRMRNKKNSEVIPLEAIVGDKVQL